MKTFLSLICILLACLLAVGCSTAESTATEPQSATEQPGVTNATQANEDTDTTDATNAPEVPGQTVPATIALPTGAPVETLRSYTKKYVPYDYGDGMMGDSSFDHNIQVPNINCESVDAIRINEKLQSVCNTAIAQLEKGEEENNIYLFGYDYKYQNGILGLVQHLGYGAQSAGLTTLYNLYYLDMATGTGLTYSEYVTALGLTEDSVLDALRASGAISTETYPDWTLVGLVTDDTGSLIVIETEYSTDGIAYIESKFTPLK